MRILHTFRHATGKAFDFHQALDLLHDTLPEPAEDMLHATRNYNASLADTSASLATEFSDAADTLSDALALALITQATQREKQALQRRTVTKVTLSLQYTSYTCSCFTGLANGKGTVWKC